MDNRRKNESIIAQMGQGWIWTPVETMKATPFRELGGIIRPLSPAVFSFAHLTEGLSCPIIKFGVFSLSLFWEDGAIKQTAFEGLDSHFWFLRLISSSSGNVSQGQFMARRIGRRRVRRRRHMDPIDQELADLKKQKDPESLERLHELYAIKAHRSRRELMRY